MGNYAIYDLANGKIDRMMACPDNLIDLQIKTGETYIIAGDEIKDTTHYIDLTTTPTITQKQEMSVTLNKTMIIADTIDTLTISGVPNPVDVVWPDGFSETVTDGLVEFATNTPGNFEIRLMGIQWLEEVVNVQADPDFT